MNESPYLMDAFEEVPVMLCKVAGQVLGTDEIQGFWGPHSGAQLLWVRGLGKKGKSKQGWWHQSVLLTVPSKPKYKKVTSIHNWLKLLLSQPYMGYMFTLHG